MNVGDGGSKLQSVLIQFTYNIFVLTVDVTSISISNVDLNHNSGVISLFSVIFEIFKEYYKYQSFSLIHIIDYCQKLIKENERFD